jgi:tetratricopeptide (TPR) repeat protein
MGDTEKALDHFTRALRGDPDHKRSRAKLKMVKLLIRTKSAGTQAFKARKYDEALKLYVLAGI